MSTLYSVRTYGISHVDLCEIRQLYHLIMVNIRSYITRQFYFLVRWRLESSRLT